MTSGLTIRSLDKDTMISESCCIGDNRCLETKTELTDREQTALRAAKMKADWLSKMMKRGLSGRIVYDDEVAIGFIEYMPIELSLFHKGENLYIVNCMVAPHVPPWGGPHRPRIAGCGGSLVHAMIKDIKNKCKGIVTPLGFAYTENLVGFFMKFGFEEFENEGLKMLIKKFEPVELPLSVCYERKYEFQRVPDKVVIDIFWSHRCPVDPFNLLNVREVCKEFTNRVILNEFCIDDQGILKKHGIESGTYVNGEFPWSTFGPLEKEEIRKVLAGILSK